MIPLADDMMAKMKPVADAIGIDVNRGDSLTVSSSAFIQELEVGHHGMKEHGSVQPESACYDSILAIVILGIVRPLLNRILFHQRRLPQA